MKTKEQKYLDTLGLIAAKLFEKTYDWNYIEETLKENGFDEDEIFDIKIDVGYEEDEHESLMLEMQEIKEREESEENKYYEALASMTNEMMDEVNDWGRVVGMLEYAGMKEDDISKIKEEIGLDPDEEGTPEIIEQEFRALQRLVSASENGSQRESGIVRVECSETELPKNNKKLGSYSLIPKKGGNR